MWGFAAKICLLTKSVENMSWKTLSYTYAKQALQLIN